MLRCAACRFGSIGSFVASFGLMLALLALNARGQVTGQFLAPATGTGAAQQVPSPIYFTTLPSYFSGNFRNSLALFSAEARGGIKNANSQWIDAIVYYTMAGECYHQLGQPKLALAQYDAALKIYVNYSDWMMRVQFPQGIAPAINAVRATPWGQSKRGATWARLAKRSRWDRGRSIKRKLCSREASSKPRLPFRFTLQKSSAAHRSPSAAGVT